LVEISEENILSGKPVAMLCKAKPLRLVYWHKAQSRGSGLD